MDLATNIRKAREKKGMTQEELARKSDITLSSLYKIEKNKVNPSFRVVASIAKALDVSLDSLK